MTEENINDSEDKTTEIAQSKKKKKKKSEWLWEGTGSAQ